MFAQGKRMRQLSSSFFEEFSIYACYFPQLVLNTSYVHTLEIRHCGNNFQSYNYNVGDFRQMVFFKEYHLRTTTLQCRNKLTVFQCRVKVLLMAVDAQ